MKCKFVSAGLLSYKTYEAGKYAITTCVC